MLWLLSVALLVLFVRNGFNIEGTAKDVRRIIRKIGKVIRDLGRTVRQGIEEAKKETAETRKNAAAQETAETPVQPANAAVQPEAKENNELLKDLEQHTNIASMLANVPTLDFPKDDPKYDSSRKCMYA